MLEDQPAIPYDEWNEKLNTVFALWRPNAVAAPGFSAKVLHRSVGSFDVVKCVCDPCGARRHGREISADEQETLAMQLVLSGQERFTIDSDSYNLGPGDLLVWNTTRPMAFEVTERLQKISVLMPLARLRSWLPGSWHTIESKYASGSATATMLHSLISAMAPEFFSGQISNGEALTEAMIGTLVSSFGSINRPDECHKHQMLLKVKRFINEHLEDVELSPAFIASIHKISLRTLHSLFEEEGQTVLQYVIHQRLLRCQRELSNPSMAQRTITEIALSWGFQHPTHFSRRFKTEFGVTPHEYRHDAIVGISR
ncbi:AraC family transcriptional regulator [Pseudomonas sp. ABAC61]|nr:AraC family transcriptional regulator [Pseudomonas sp. ABAC61]